MRMLLTSMTYLIHLTYSCLINKGRLMSLYKAHPYPLLQNQIQTNTNIIRTQTWLAERSLYHYQYEKFLTTCGALHWFSCFWAKARYSQESGCVYSSRHVYSAKNIIHKATIGKEFWWMCIVPPEITDDGGFSKVMSDFGAQWAIFICIGGFYGIEGNLQGPGFVYFSNIKHSLHWSQPLPQYHKVQKITGHFLIWNFWILFPKLSPPGTWILAHTKPLVCGGVAVSVDQNKGEGRVIEQGCSLGCLRYLEYLAIIESQISLPMTTIHWHLWVKLATWGLWGVQVNTNQ